MNSNKTVTATFGIPGMCGIANGQTLTSKPTTNLCIFGYASAVSGSGPWSWTCQGTNGAPSVNCSANIQQEMLRVTKAGAGSGSVTPNNGTINWKGNAGTVNFNYGTRVVLTATPNPGIIFTGWSGVCSGKGTCSLTMTSPQSVTATFVPDIFQY